MEFTLDAVELLRFLGDLVDGTRLLLTFSFLGIETLSKALLEEIHMIVLWLKYKKVMG